MSIHPKIRQRQPGYGASITLLPPFLPIVVGLILFGAGGHDDTHISYWPAYTLGHFGQLGNYNGDAIEQSSSLAWVVVLAALSRALGMAIETLAPVTSVLCGAATVYATQRLVARVSPDLVLGAGLLAGASASLSYWAWSGMETAMASLLSALVVLACIDVLRNWSVAQAGWALLAIIAFLLVRPENGLVALFALGGAIGVVWLQHRRRHASEATGVSPLPLVALFGVVVVASVVIALVRFGYSGQLVPQPVLAKMALSWGTIRSGLAYLRAEAVYDFSAGLWALAVVGLIVHMGDAWRRHEVPIATMLPLLFGLSSVAFVVSAGGDWMEAGRFLVPALPFVVLSAMLAIRKVVPRPAHLVVIGVVVLLQAIGSARLAATASAGTPIWELSALADLRDSSGYSWFEVANDFHRGDLEFLARAQREVERVGRHKSDPVLIMSGQMGFIPFHLARLNQGRVRFVDRHGLVTDEFTKCSYGRRLLRGPLGLEFRMSRYFADYEIIRRLCRGNDPDIILDYPSIAAEYPPNGYVVLFERDERVLAVRAEFYSPGQ